MKATLETLQILVSNELTESKKELVAKDWAYIDLIEILRHLDSTFIQSYLNKKTTIQDGAFFESIRYAWIGLVSSYLDHIKQEQTQLIYESSDEHKEWAKHILGWSGDLEIVNRFLIAAKAGLVEISETKDRVFHITFPHEIIEKEHYDRNSYFYAKQLAVRNNQSNYQRHIEKYKTIKKQMLARLNIIKDTFISYSSSPDIDRYFSQLGYFHLKKELAFEDFGAEDTFGGLAYRKYLDVLREVSSVALKHLHYCIIATEKHPKLDFHNIAIYTWHEDKTIEDFSTFTGLSVPSMKQIFACLTLDKSNIKEYESVKGSDLPPYIKIAENNLTRTIYGVLGGGVDFLKRELKRRYPDDYYKAVNLREARFRNDIYQYFKGERFLRVNEEIEIKIPGLHTDIDGAIYDTKTKTLGLFQLKWQDMFYTSLQERRSRISNVYKSAEGLVTKIQQWLEITSQADVMKKLKFDTTFRDYHTIHLFVIARSQIHYTGLEPEPIAAWATWYQMVESYEKYKTNTKDPIKGLYDQLKMGLPSNRVVSEGYPKSPNHGIKFKTFSFNFYEDTDES